MGETNNKYNTATCSHSKDMDSGWSQGNGPRQQTKWASNNRRCFHIFLWLRVARVLNWSSFLSFSNCRKNYTDPIDNWVKQSKIETSKILNLEFNRPFWVQSLIVYLPDSISNCRGYWNSVSHCYLGFQFDLYSGDCWLVCWFINLFSRFSDRDIIFLRELIVDHMANVFYSVTGRL